MMTNSDQYSKVNHSFAVLAYQDSPYLPACLDSLKNQTIPSEIYISTSTPSLFIEKLADQHGIKVYVTDAGQGIAYDWNFSLQHAHSKYVTLAHQDDLYMPHYTAECLEAAERYTDTLICFTDYIEIVGHDERARSLLLVVKKIMLSSFMLFKKNIQSPRWKKYLLSTGNPIAAPTVMYHLSLLQNFRFTEQFSINMDWDAWLRISEMKGRFVYVNQPLVKHRIHPESATTIGLKLNTRQKEDQEMFRRFWPKFFAQFIANVYAASYNSNKTNH